MLPQDFLTKIEQTQSAAELCGEINVLDAIHCVTRALNNTNESTIQKYFRVAGFPCSDPDTIDSSTDDNDDNDDDNVPLSELAKQLQLSPNRDPCFDDSIPT